MKLEIERKFRVRSDEWRAFATREIPIRQGYIAHGPHLVVRVRLTDTDARLTVKAEAAGLVREEFEFEMKPSDAQRLLDGHVNGCVIEKKRYVIPDSGLIWEIDVFEGYNQGLVIAEVELESEGQVFKRPQWIGNEITGEQRFYNNSLAKHPFTVWSERERGLGLT
ncbi:MAG: CYTH domain-containing protein [Gammaproteobacteria bacterium]